MKEKCSETLVIRVPSELLTRIEVEATKRGLPVSSFARSVLYQEMFRF